MRLGSIVRRRSLNTSRSGGNVSSLWKSERCILQPYNALLLPNQLLGFLPYVRSSVKCSKPANIVQCVGPISIHYTGNHQNKSMLPLSHDDVVTLSRTRRTSFYGSDNLASDLRTNGRMWSRSNDIEQSVLLIRCQI